MNTLPYPPRRRTALSAALSAAVAAAGLLAVPVGPAHAAQEGCVAVEQQPSTWNIEPDRGGFILTITLTNLCDDPIVGWELGFTLAPGHTVSQGWNAAWNLTSQRLTATGLPWNEVLEPGTAVTFGLLGTWVGAFVAPVNCTVNGWPCSGGSEPNLPPEVTLTSPYIEQVFELQGVTLAADADDPDGEIDRVEFYLDGELVGVDQTAPYQIGLDTRQIGLGPHTVFARAFDDGDPSLSTDSQTATFTVVNVVPPSVAAEPWSLEVEAGGSAVVNIRLFGTPAATISIGFFSGGDGISVSPQTFTLNNDHRDQDVVVSADASAAGSTTVLNASHSGHAHLISVTVVAPG